MRGSERHETAHAFLSHLIVRRRAAYTSFVKAGAVEGTHACGPVIILCPEGARVRVEAQKGRVGKCNRAGRAKGKDVPQGNGPVVSGVPTTLVVPWQLFEIEAP